MKCCRCKKELPEIEFYPHKTNMRGYQWECKKCRAEMQREYQKRRKEHVRAYAKEYYRTHKEGRKRTLRKYGLTLEQYDEKLKAQKGSCAICKIPIKKPDVDHDHKTGKTRGLLCQRCNLWLAPIENERFHKAAEAYLEKYKIYKNFPEN